MWGEYPLVNKQFAIENGHKKMIYPLKMVIFHSYVDVYRRVCFPSTKWTCLDQATLLHQAAGLEPPPCAVGACRACAWSEINGDGSKTVNPWGPGKPLQAEVDC